MHGGYMDVRIKGAWDEYNRPRHVSEKIIKFASENDVKAVILIDYCTGQVPIRETIQNSQKYSETGQLKCLAYLPGNTPDENRLLKFTTNKIMGTRGDFAFNIYYDYDEAVEWIEEQLSIE